MTSLTCPTTVLRGLALVALAASALLLGGCDVAATGDEAGEQVARAEDSARDVEGEAAASGVALPSLTDTIEGVQPSIVAVEVRAQGRAGRGEGSGVVWDEDGTIVTNAHVVGRGDRISVVLATGERLKAEVVGTDERTDLAVLEVDRDDLPAAEFAEDVPDVGEWVIALGNPFGFENTATVGIVSGLQRSIPSGGRTPALVNLVQTDAAISPGNSGGALVGTDGRVVGINVAYIPPVGGAVSLGFAIPMPTVRYVVEQLVEGDDVKHAYLGVDVAPMSPGLARLFNFDVVEGALVLGVAANSPASKAGIKRGSVIMKVADTRIETVEDLYGALRRQQPGDEVEVTVVHKTDRESYSVELAELP